uniref:Uncharacterized protein n=1 Tax=Lepeophtheirus salmonis TaxID=72036 RepID=A0A0K2SX45_LEPSM
MNLTELARACQNSLLEKAARFESPFTIYPYFFYLKM